MLSFEDLQLIQNIEPFANARTNIFYFPNVDSTASHFIESLIFRLENVDSTSIIILADRKKVRPTDVKKGLFVEQDYNKNRSDVIMKRFTGLCKTKIYSTSRMVSNMFSAISNDVNMFYMSFNENTTEQDLNVQINSIKNVQQNIGVNPTQNPELELKAYLFRIGTNENKITLKFNEVTKTRTTGTTEVIQNVKKSSPTQSQFVRNVMASQVLFNMVNSILTDNMTVNYTDILFDYEEGMVDTTYLMGLPTTSIFNKLHSDSLNQRFNVKQLLKVSKEFDSFVSHNQRALEYKFGDLQSVTNDTELDNYLSVQGRLLDQKINNLFSIANSAHSNQINVNEYVKNKIEETNLFIDNGIKHFEDNQENISIISLFLKKLLSKSYTVRNLNNHHVNEIVSNFYDFIENQYLDLKSLPTEFIVENEQEIVNA